MKLEKFKEKNHKKIGIIMFTLSCILLITIAFFYHSFASYNVFKDFNVIHGNVEDPGDLSFAYYVDDQITHDVPTKDSGYTLSSKSICTNGVKVSWDEENWVAIVNYSDYQKNLSSKVKCNLFFEERKPKLTDYITMLSNTDSTQLKYDETVDNNLRYIGKDPNNYVSFNHELWRIIGVMNHIDDGTGKKESRIKLIRDESIGLHSWDVSLSTVNSGAGVNEWSKSTLMKLLNPGYETEAIGGSLYWNRKAGSCYGNSLEAVDCDFSFNGLNASSKEMIGKTFWNVGSNSPDVNSEDIIGVQFYDFERSEDTGKICFEDNGLCDDLVDRTTNWIGYVGLLYPSDYVFATSGGDEDERDACLNYKVSNWNELNDCFTNNWIYKSDSDLWTLMPLADSWNSTFVYSISQGAYIVGFSASTKLFVYPTLYLKENVKIVSGEGSRENPFIIKN